MALDWDRDWQAWPVTVLVGCYAGWAVGKTLLGPFFYQGKRIDMGVGGERGARDSLRERREPGERNGKMDKKIS